MRWLIVFLLACLLLNGLKGLLARIGLGRLPGDFTFRVAGREWFVPLASSLLLSLVAMGIAALL
jgi:Protein of unknown function (DUF2905)